MSTAYADKAPERAANGIAAKRAGPIAQLPAGACS